MQSRDSLGMPSARPDYRPTANRTVNLTVAANPNPGLVPAVAGAAGNSTMSAPLSNLVIFATCYVISGIPFGFLIGKLKGGDIRDHGSGNIGATNVLRTYGRTWGGICLALDVVKGYVPVLIACCLPGGIDAMTANVYTPIIAVFGTVSGHMWTPYLHFRGGKGIATSAGAVLAIASAPVLVALAVWIVVFLVSRYVSLASITAAVCLPTSAVVMRHFSGPAAASLSVPVIVLLCCLGLLAVVRHRSNIRRLINGTENRFVRKGKVDQ